MKLLVALIRWALMAALVVACATPAILIPPKGLYPCGGPDDVECRAGDKLVACCPSETVCGGTPFSGCPSSYCCFVGDGAAGGDMHEHHHPNVPQRPVQGACSAEGCAPPSR